MIDEKTFETLSRYIDGDLEPDEVAGFEKALAENDELQRALNDIRGLRGDLRAMALNEEPPAVLDHMVRPLRRGGRPVIQRWTVAAVLAAAAVIVVSVIVVEEIGQTGWRPWEQASPDDDQQIFALSNLPPGDPDAPIGAIENLLAEGNPEPEMVELEPVDVMGPLNQPPGSEDSNLILKVGSILVPVAIPVGNEGLRVKLGVEAGRVTSCDPPEGMAPTQGTDDVCRKILSVRGIGLSDGRHNAVVVSRSGPIDSGQ